MILATQLLTACFCLPEPGEGVDSNYFDNCWKEAKSGEPNESFFARP